MRRSPALGAALSRAVRLVLVLTAVLVGSLGLSTAASAAPLKTMWGNVKTPDGASEFPTYKALGVDLYMSGHAWAGIAPTKPANPTDPNDPAYRWPADLDFAVSEGARLGIGVGVLIMYAPAWSNGNNASVVPPTNADDYAQFLEALAKRYPTIRHFQVWGEPNLTNKFAITPSPTRDYYATKGNAKGQPKALSKKQQKELQGLAKIIDATSVRLKALNPKNMIIGGNTTTSGSVDPFSFAKYLRLSNGKPPRMDLYGHNPFGTRGPDLKKDQIVPGTADMSDLDEFKPWVKRYLSRSGRNAKLNLFAIEYTAPTDEPSNEFPYYVTRKLQATWLKAAWKITKSEKLYGLGWISLRDNVDTNDPKKRSRIGLIDLEGKQKPSYNVYKGLR